MKKAIKRMWCFLWKGHQWPVFHHHSTSSIARVQFILEHAYVRCIRCEKVSISNIVTVGDSIYATAKGGNLF